MYKGQKYSFSDYFGKEIFDSCLLKAADPLLEKCSVLYKKKLLCILVVCWTKIWLLDFSVNKKGLFVFIGL